jgi:hypothetical protein
VVGLTNTINDTDDWAAGIRVSVQRDGGGTYRFRVTDVTDLGGSDQTVISAGTTYYLVVTRSSTTCTVQIYSDAARTNLLDTLSITCATTAFRYLYVTSSRNVGGANNCTGFSENIKDKS